MADPPREQIHTQRPTEVEVLRGEQVLATTTAGFTVRFVYEDEVPDSTDWQGRFEEVDDGFDPDQLVGEDDVVLRLATSGLTGRIRLVGEGAFTGVGPAPVETPTK